MITSYHFTVCWGLRWKLLMGIILVWMLKCVVEVSDVFVFRRQILDVAALLRQSLLLMHLFSQGYEIWNKIRRNL